VTSQDREEQQIVLERLRHHARFLADAYGLPLRSVDAERANVKRRYGICYEDGSIRVRLRSLRSGELLKYSSLMDTLCHELAHLKYFDHSPRFWRFYRKVLGYAQRHGMYRPGSEPERRRPEAPLLQQPLLPGDMGPVTPRPRPQAPLRAIQLELF
jgi:hypothetical protein